MIKFVKGDIFQAKVEALVCPVNCVGIMGKGLALAFKQKYPLYYRAYVLTHTPMLQPGRVIGYNVTARDDAPAVLKTIFSAATKEHWSAPSRIEWVKHVLESLKDYLLLSTSTIKSLALPLLGAGNGRLPVGQVVTNITRILSPLTMGAVGIDIRVVDPQCK